MPAAHEVMMHMDAVLLVLRTVTTGSGSERKPLTTEFYNRPGATPVFAPASDAQLLARDLYSDLQALLHQRIEGLRILKTRIPAFADDFEVFENAVFRFAAEAGWGEEFLRG